MLDALKAGRIGAAEMANWATALENPLARAIAFSAYVRARLLSDPRLTSVLGIEIGLGLVTTLAAEKAARGDRFLPEIDFVLANQVLITLTNIALVMALTPAAAVAPPPAAGTVSAYLSKLPGFFLQSGDFSASQRAACFFSKAAMFSCVGTCTSATGQFITKGLVAARTRLQPSNPPTVELAPVLSTSAAYAAFMAGSSNTRYQLVNSFEALLLPSFPAATRTAISTVVRTGNNYVGSASWIWWAKFCGLQ